MSLRVSRGFARGRHLTNRHRGEGCPSSPAAPPGMRVSTGRFEKLRFKRVGVPQLAPLRSAFYPLLVHRPAVSLHASFPHSVSLMQLRFASLAVTCLRRDFHP
jgi:hypothetical protein